MKKILFTLLALITLAFGLQFSQVFADSTTDIFTNESDIQDADWYHYALLENSNYHLTIIFDNDQALDQPPYINLVVALSTDINMTTSSSLVQVESPLGDLNGTTVYDGTFNTDTYMFLNFWVENDDPSLWSDAISNGSIHINLYWLGNTVPVDEVDPEFSYSNLSVDTSYDDLITASEIQAQLHATDDEDGDVTSRIEIYEDHYTSVSTKVVGGDYYIMFRVSDTSGNYAYLRVDIEVVDENPPHIFTATGDPLGGAYSVTGVYEDGYVFNYSWYYGQPVGAYETFWLNYYLGDQYYGIWDFEDASWVEGGSNLTLFNTDPNEIGVGTYNFTYTITDPSGNTASYTFNLSVLQNQAPVINGSASVTAEATTFNLASILSSYSATDTEDGTATITANPVDSETHSNAWTSSPTVGAHILYLSAIDSMGLETIKEVTVHVVDTTIPVIKVSGIAATTYDLTVNMSNTSAYTTFINSITATDAYYGTITGSLVFPAVPSFALPGTVEKTITVTDASGNTGSLVVSITVVDDILPVINGAVKVVKGKTATMTLSEITAQISAVDNVDGSISVQVVQDGYTGNATIVGSYLVKYKATDSSGNISYHDVRVWVVDNVAPVWVVDDFFINLGLNESMTRTELVALLQASGMVANDISYTVTFLTDEYTGNEELEGVYSVVMRVTYEDGSEDEISVQLSVPEDMEDGDVIVVTPEEDLTGLQKTIEWVKTAAVNIWNFIQDAWNAIKTVAGWIYDNILYPIYEFIFVKDTQIIPDTIASIRYYFAR